jgi:hypothetical protein
MMKVSGNQGGGVSPAVTAKASPPSDDDPHAIGYCNARQQMRLGFDTSGDPRLGAATYHVVCWLFDEGVCPADQVPRHYPERIKRLLPLLGGTVSRLSALRAAIEKGLVECRQLSSLRIRALDSVNGKVPVTRMLQEIENAVVVGVGRSCCRVRSGATIYQPSLWRADLHLSFARWAMQKIIRPLGQNCPKKLQECAQDVEELSYLMHHEPEALLLGNDAIVLSPFLSYGRELLQRLESANSRIDEETTPIFYGNLPDILKAEEEFRKRFKKNVSAVLHLWNVTCDSSSTPSLSSLYSLYSKLHKTTSVCRINLLTFFRVCRAYSSSMQQLPGIAPEAKTAIDNGTGDLHAYILIRFVQPFSTLESGLASQLRYAVLTKDAQARRALQAVIEEAIAARKEICALQPPMDLSLATKTFEGDREACELIDRLAELRSGLMIDLQSSEEVVERLESLWKADSKQGEPEVQLLAKLGMLVDNMLARITQELEGVTMPQWDQWHELWQKYAATASEEKSLQIRVRSNRVYALHGALLVVCRRIQTAHAKWHRELRRVCSPSPPRHRKKLKRPNPAQKVIGSAPLLAKGEELPLLQQLRQVVRAQSLGQSRRQDLLLAEAILAEHLANQESTDGQLGSLGALHRLVELSLKIAWEAAPQNALGNREHQHNLQSLALGLRSSPSAARLHITLANHASFIERLSAAHQFVDFGAQATRRLGKHQEHQPLRDLYQAILARELSPQLFSRDWIEPGLELCLGLLQLPCDENPLRELALAVTDPPPLPEEESEMAADTAAAHCVRLVKDLLEQVEERRPESAELWVLQDLHLQLQRLHVRLSAPWEQRLSRLLMTYWEGTDFAVRSLQSALLASLLHLECPKEKELEKRGSMHHWFRTNGVIRLSETVRQEWMKREELKRFASFLPKDHQGYGWLSRLHATLCYPHSSCQGPTLELPPPLLALRGASMTLRAYQGELSFEEQERRQKLRQQALQQAQQLETTLLIPLLHLTLHVLAHGFPEKEEEGI